MFLIKKSSLLILCILFTTNLLYSQTAISLANVKEAVSEELKEIFSHNDLTSSYEVYSLKIDDVEEEEKLYTTTGSFKFKDSDGAVSSSISFNAQVKSVLNELTVPIIMVNFDDVINSWKSPEVVIEKKEKTPDVSLDEMKEKLMERAIDEYDVSSVQKIIFNDYTDESTSKGYFISIKARMYYTNNYNSEKTARITAHLKPVGNSYVVTYFDK